MLGKGSNALNILKRFGGKTVHKVELDRVFACIKRHVDSAHNVFFAHVLVDDVAQSLRTRFGCKGQGGRANRFNAAHQILVKTVHTQGGQRQTDHIVVGPIQELIAKGFERGIVADGKRRKRNLLISCRVVKLLCLTVEHIGAFFAHRAVDHTRLTETATADATAIDLKHNAVVHRFNIGHNDLVGEVDLVEILDDLLCYLLGNIVIDRRVCLDGSVLVISNFIERGDIHTGDGFGGFVQEIGACVAAVFLHLDVKACDGREHLFTLTNVEQIKKVCNRFGVVGARTTADDERIIFTAILCTQRQLCQREHIEHICVAHFVLQREANKIKSREGIATLQCGQGQVVLAHLLLHIGPRGKYALAPNVGVRVERAVEQSHPQIGHTNFIRIGEAESKTRFYVGFVFDNLTVLAACISAGLGDRFENGTVEFGRMVHNVPFLRGLFFAFEMKRLLVDD